MYSLCQHAVYNLSTQRMYYSPSKKLEQCCPWQEASTYCYSTQTYTMGRIVGTCVYCHAITLTVNSMACTKNPTPHPPNCSTVPGIAMSISRL